MTDVKVLAIWDGWCSPCGEERPLVLVETGRRGVRAWLKGICAEDRDLTLTCRVCGQWQAVPQHEEDDPDVSVVPLILATGVSGRSITVAYANAPAAVPAPRTEWPVLLTSDTDTVLLDLLAGGLDVVTSRAS
ncbi:MAG: hypothetical protein LC789_01810 [Actinobacteria bacterium]|nr:hypothetical protein [Actinomycetota bacterium]MCA1721191.1 hypothetical protein [Actinomycetota bacterium]